MKRIKTLNIIAGLTLVGISLVSCKNDTKDSNNIDIGKEVKSITFNTVSGSYDENRNEIIYTKTPVTLNSGMSDEEFMNVLYKNHPEWGVTNSNQIKYINNYMELGSFDENNNMDGYNIDKYEVSGSMYISKDNSSYLESEITNVNKDQNGNVKQNYNNTSCYYKEIEGDYYYLEGSPYFDKKPSLKDEYLIDNVKFEAYYYYSNGADENYAYTNYDMDYYDEDCVEKIKEDEFNVCKQCSRIQAWGIQDYGCTPYAGYVNLRNYFENFYSYEKMCEIYSEYQYYYCNKKIRDYKIKHSKIDWKLTENYIIIELDYDFSLEYAMSSSDDDFIFIDEDEEYNYFVNYTEKGKNYTKCTFYLDYNVNNLSIDADGADWYQNLKVKYAYCEDNHDNYLENIDILQINNVTQEFISIYDDEVEEKVKSLGTELMNNCKKLSKEENVLVIKLKKDEDE